jgi:hypothetical protein
MKMYPKDGLVLELEPGEALDLIAALSVEVRQALVGGGTTRPIRLVVEAVEGNDKSLAVFVVQLAASGRGIDYTS